MWLSCILFLLTLLPGLCGQNSFVPASHESQPLGAEPRNKTEWILVEGEVEMDRLEALESAEQKARQALWERFSPTWKDRGGMLVPAERLDTDLEAWVTRHFEQLAPVQALPVQVFESSVGEAYRKSYRIQVAGPKAESFRRAGDARASALSGRFQKSFLLIVLMVSVLFWGASRMDRLTRGYLTWRIRLVSLALAGMGIFVIYPHA